MRDLSGYSALVTGGASGLGLATAQALASAGVKVAALDLQRQLRIGGPRAGNGGGDPARHLDVVLLDQIGVR